MPEALPIVCSLSAGDLRTRLTEMADLGQDALLGAHREGAHAQLRFAAGAGVRDRLDAVVAAESHCCAFLTLRVAEEADAVVLSIDAPEDAALAVAELVDAFASTAAAA